MRYGVRVRLILLSWLLGGFYMALVPVSAQTNKQPLVVSISAEAPATENAPDSFVVKAGSDVFIKVHITNVSRRNFSLNDDADSRTGVDFYHRYEVRDSTGNYLPKRPIKHPEIGSTGHGWPARILKPGASFDWSDRLSGLYDFTQPGEYTIQMWRAMPGNPNDGEVKSNSITLTVIE
jgi:hypothetical protein